MQLPATFTMQPIPWQRRMLMGAIPAVFLLVLLVRAVMVGTPETWVFLLVLVPALGFVFYRAEQQLRSVRLTLEDTGFRYSRTYYDISVPWGEVRTVQRRMRRGKLVALAILTAQGKYLSLGGFERLPEIADFIDSRVKSQEPDAVGAFRLNQNAAWLFVALFVGGIWVRMHYGGHGDLYDFGLLLQMGGLAGIFWMSPLNLRIRRWTPVRRFFVLLIIWVAIVLIALLLLNSFSPKH